MSHTVDLLIAGSGSGALTAAIMARELGLEVALFEKASRVGGGTAFSGGVVWVPDNHVMRRKGIPDSVDEALTYLEAAGHGRGDKGIAAAYCENAARIVEAVEGWTGIKWIIWPGQPDYYAELPGAKLNGRALLQHPAAAHATLAAFESAMPALALVRDTPHMDFVPGFQTSDRPAREAWVAGRAIIGGLWKANLERNLEYRVATPVLELMIEDGRVAGVVVQNPDGSHDQVRARRGVLLNTGGFDWNRELTARYLPDPTVTPQTPPTNTGDGHILAMALGAATALMDKAVWHPSILIPGDVQDDGSPLYRMFNAELSKPHCVVVDRTGCRFAPESTYFALSDAWMEVDSRSRAQPHVPSYFIADSVYRAKYGLPGLAEDTPAPAWITVADSLPELAESLGINRAGLIGEIATYNRDCPSGVDSRFGRGSYIYERYWGDPEQKPNPTMGSIGEPPFYGFPLHLSHAGTRGGVVTTRNAEVVRVDGTVIPGLYACGNTAANLLFGHGYGSGSAVGSSMIFGCLAAERAARS